MAFEDGKSCYAQLVTSKTSWACHDSKCTAKKILKGQVHYRLYYKASDSPVQVNYGDGVRYHLPCKPKDIEVKP